MQKNPTRGVGVGGLPQLIFEFKAAKVNKKVKKKIGWFSSPESLKYNPSEEVKKQLLSSTAGWEGGGAPGLHQVQNCHTGTERLVMVVVVG